MTTQTKPYLGYIGVLGALTIWTSWMLLTRHAAQSSLSGLDLSALRYLVAGILLLPFVIMKLGRRLLSKKLVGLSLFMGAPYMLLVATGIAHSSAAHAATFINGSMILVSVLTAAQVFGTKITAPTIGGVGTVIIGLFLMGGVAKLNLGDVFFISAGAMWAVYSVLLQKWKIQVFDAILAVNTWSFLLFALPYTILHSEFLTQTPLPNLLIHGFFQGVLTSIVAHVFFAMAVKNLGAARVSFFVPLVPVITGLLGAWLLDENLARVEWIGIGLVTLGIVATKVKWSSKTQKHPHRTFILKKKSRGTSCRETIHCQIN